MRKSGDRVRITAQLVNAADGGHLWSETFDRELDDVFAIQDEIARQVADALSVTLGLDENVLTPGGTENIQAYELVFRAWGVWAHVSVEDRGPPALDLYRQALVLDPDYAQAWLGMAQSLIAVASYEADPERARELVRESDRAVDRALTLAPNMGEAHLRRGFSLTGARDWSGAAAAFARADELAPPHFRDCRRVAMPELGFRDEPVVCARARRDNDPLSLPASANLQTALIAAASFEEAEAEYHRSLSLVGDREPVEHGALPRSWEQEDAATVEARMRRYLEHNSVDMPVFHEVLDVFDDAAAACALLRAALDDPFYETGPRLMLLALWLGHYGDPEGAADAIRRYSGRPTAGNSYLMWFLSLAETRRLPAFKDIVRDLGMVDYWRETGNWGDFCRPLDDNDFECE